VGEYCGRQVSASNELLSCPEIGLHIKCKKMGKKTNETLIQKAGIYFTEEEKHKVIKEFISTKCTKQQIWHKYTGETAEHGQLVRWMRRLGYDTAVKRRRPNIASNFHQMPDNIQQKLQDQSFENLQLKKRVAELEKQLKDAELKAIAYSAMVDLAEKEFKVPIRKKLNTKP
jgi:CRISPR/Cas system-associated endonuclease Cas1